MFTVTEVRELSPIRKIVAAGLGESYRQAIHVTLHREVSAGTALELCAEHRKGESPAPNIMDCAIRAAVLGLQEHADFNGVFKDGKHMLVKEKNIGFAVETPRGLIVPVLKNAQDLGLVEIARRRRELTEAVMAWRHTLDDIQEGTFSVTNLGALGVDSFTPIIYPPQVAILGIGRVREELALLSEGRVGTGKRMTLCLSFDHRVVDGAMSGRFLGAIAGHLENPAALAGTPRGLAAHW